MDLEKEFRNGDRVVCIKEKDIQSFIGKVWTVKFIEKELIYCENLDEYVSSGIIVATTRANCFPFRRDEIALLTPLMEELL